MLQRRNQTQFKRTTYSEKHFHYIISFQLIYPGILTRPGLFLQYRNFPVNIPWYIKWKPPVYMGVILDSTLSFKSQESNTVRSCFSVLRQIQCTYRSLSRPLLKVLVQALVIPRLEYTASPLSVVYRHPSSKDYKLFSMPQPEPSSIPAISAP